MLSALWVQQGSHSPLSVSYSQVVPDEFDIDKEFYGDVSMSAEYAKEIFDYLREREVRFCLGVFSYRSSYGG